MKNIFIAIAVLTSFSACNTVHTNIAVNPNNTETRFCNLGCPFHGIGVGTHGGASTGTASHGVGATMGGMGHGAASGAAARK